MGCNKNMTGWAVLLVLAVLMSGVAVQAGDSTKTVDELLRSIGGWPGETIYHMPFDMVIAPLSSAPRGGVVELRLGVIPTFDCSLATIAVSPDSVELISPDGWTFRSEKGDTAWFNIRIRVMTGITGGIRVGASGCGVRMPSYAHAYFVPFGDTLAFHLGNPHWEYGSRPKATLRPNSRPAPADTVKPHPDTVHTTPGPGIHIGIYDDLGNWVPAESTAAGGPRLAVGSSHRRSEPTASGGAPVPPMSDPTPPQAVGHQVISYC